MKPLTKKPNTPANAALAATAALVLGLFVDFLTGGVFKIAFAVIYVPVYIGLASLLVAKLYHTAWENRVWPVALAFLAGAFGARFGLNGFEHTRDYTMNVGLDSPLTLKSPDFPQILIVSGKKVPAELARTGARTGIPVVTAFTANYGCIQRYLVNTVAGVDVRYDKDSSWVWKTDSASSAPDSNGPGSEDSGYPWCKIKFF